MLTLWLCTGQIQPCKLPTGDGRRPAGHAPRAEAAGSKYLASHGANSTVWLREGRVPHTLRAILTSHTEALTTYGTDQGVDLYGSFTEVEESGSTKA